MFHRQGLISVHTESFGSQAKKKPFIGAGATVGDTEVLSGGQERWFFLFRRNFLLGKGGQALERAAQGGLESKGHLDKVGICHSWDSMVLEVFSNLNN